MNTKTDEVVYFSVYEPGGKALASFRTREAAEVFAFQERSKRSAEIDDNKETMTQGEYRGAINFAPHGITVRTMSLVFEDSLYRES